MGAITKKDLSIFRGTYEEIKNLPTEDMRIYLSWDTQEIFIGNSIGTKVPYGVPKILFNKIDRDLKNIEDKLNEKYDLQVDILVQQHLKEFLDSSEFSDSVKSEIERLFNNFKATVESNINRLDGSITEINNKIRSNKEETDKKLSDIEEKIPKKVSELENDSNYLTEHQSLDNYYTKQDVDSEIKKATENIDLTEYYTKAQIDKKLEDISAGDIDLSNYYNKEQTELKIDEKINQIQFPEIPSKISDLENDSNFVSTDNLDSKLLNYATKNDLKNIDSQFLYLTGSEMQDEKILETTKQFQTVFCTEDTAPNKTPIYKANQLYYFNGERFKQLASGSSPTKELITAIINLQLTNWPSDAEIHKEIINVSNIIASIRRISAIKDKKCSVYFDNKEITNVSKIESSLDDSATISIKDISIDASKPLYHTLEIRAEVNDATEDYEYTITNNSKKTCSFYQPWLFGELNNLIHYKSNVSTMETMISTSNATIYLYTTTKLLKNPTSGGFEVPFELNSELVSLTVNGVENVKYYEYKLVNVNDNKFTINL